MEQPKQYKKMTARAMAELAAPHTWSASIAPVALGTALAVVRAGAFSPWIFLSTLCAAVLLQCAVNTINDYTDFVKGTDTVENSDDPTDAALVYHGFRPKSALLLGLVFLALAAFSGAYTVWAAGFLPLAYGVAGGLVVVLYSGGKVPLSYLPIGELISGVVMGGLITAACYAAQTGRNDWRVLYYALPMIITIGLIMLTNNTSDIERDKLAGRRTLPVLMGRKWAARLLKAGAILALLLAAHIVFWEFRGGFFLLPVLVIGVALPLSRLLPSAVDSSVRGASMGATIQIHKTISTVFILMLVFHFIRDVL